MSRKKNKRNANKAKNKNMAKNVKFPSFDESQVKADNSKGQKLDIKEQVETEQAKELDSQETMQSETELKMEATVESDAASTIEVSDYNQILQERNDYLNHLQRLQAEFDNYRKRVQKEKSELRDFLIQDFISRLLDVIDNMDRALHPNNATQDVDSYRTGVEMVFQQLLNTLKEQGLTRIETVGQTFDPRFHEAVGQIETEEHEAGTIANELMPGYCINERVLRAPKVMVAKRPAASE